VMAAIDEVAGDGAVGRDGEAANFFFASFVHRRRHNASEVARFSLDASKARQTAVLRRCAGVFRKRDLRLKEAIRRHLAAATAAEQMRLRPQFIEILSLKRFKGSCAFLTTNWDVLLENRMRAVGDTNPRVGHLHGCVEGNAGRLLLPSEGQREPYHTVEEADAIARAELSHWKVLNAAKTIIIYGLSLSPLDAELGLTLRMALDDPKQRPSRIIVMNLASEVDRIARRVRMLTEGTTCVVSTEVLG
jgi:hypothetical protein